MAYPTRRSGSRRCRDGSSRRRDAGPGIFNTDQGAQFTSAEWIAQLTATAIRSSMDGKGRWMDTVLIARLWRSLKYECVYLDAFEHPHSSLTGYTPGEAYAGTQSLALAA